MGDAIIIDVHIIPPAVSNICNLTILLSNSIVFILKSTPIVDI